MINHFCKKPLWEAMPSLTGVCMGREAADLVIRNVKLVNVCTHEIQSDMVIAVKAGRIAFVCSAEQAAPENYIDENTQVIDGEDGYLAPGFLDGHIHVESSMLSVGEYANAVIPHGTVGIYMDPHEICNVLGLDGVKCMMEDAQRTPLKAMLTTPSCVPAVPGFEDTGSRIDASDIAETMKWDSCVGLGEMMNFPGLLGGMSQTQDIVAETLKAGKIVTGHYSMPETGRGLNAYIANGVRCCHESTREEDALAKMRLGMYAMLREGSAWHDLKEVAKAITKHEVDSRFACLVSDDAHPATLLRQGHLDHIVRRAMEEGIDAVTAIQMVTLNVAQCFQMDHELGSVTPGKCADLVLLRDLTSMRVNKVWIDGRLVAVQGQKTEHQVEYQYPEWATHSIHIDPPVSLRSFEIPCAKAAKAGKVAVHAIEIIPERVGTYDRIVTLPVRNGIVEADPSADVLKAAVFERHHGTGKVGLGFVKGFGIRCGAMASTVAHDAHNLLVVGTNDEDMLIAARALVECEGGMAVVQNGKVLGLVELPIAGLMNDLPCAEMSGKVEKMEQAWKQIGCRIASPFMTMALIALACLPEVRLTDRGLVDCRTFQFMNLFAE